PPPTVTVVATDASASESGDTGTFTISRSGSTTSALTVNYSLGGSADRSEERRGGYGSVTMSAGSSSAAVIVTPIDDSIVEGSETVVLTLAPDPADAVGSPISATGTNTDTLPPPPPPTVTVVATDASASESGDTGNFAINRSGSTTSALTVNYSLGGSAD